LRFGCGSQLQLLPLQQVGPSLVVGDKLGQGLLHEVVVLLHEPLLLGVLGAALRGGHILLLADGVLEDALHVLVVAGDGEGGEGDEGGFGASRGLEGVLLSVFDHAVELGQVADGLQILEDELGLARIHNNYIPAYHQHPLNVTYLRPLVT